ncbi:MAG: family 20 glycosylhydrolase [Acidobacteriota bacterium]|nr:family 20 glycosylhydrolase [Acidobacteriota bacterium]
MRILITILIVVFLMAICAAGQSPLPLSLMPVPSGVQLGSGELQITQAFSVGVAGVRDAALERGVQRFLVELSHETGIPLKPRTGQPSNPTLRIQAEHDRQQVQKREEDESYELDIDGNGARLTAPTPLGILHGLQTFLQLVHTSATGFAAPQVTIKDQPRFVWRGLLIDVGRHFIPPDVLKRDVDGMAAVKLNVLHLHLSDNEGFRVESKRFPKLHEAGSDGLYYTQDQIRDFVSYAHDRGIRVIPEFDIPGHSRSWFLGYPELASNPGPYTLGPGGGDPLMDPTRESTYKFLEKFVAEMGTLFPDAYFHIGGDEVNGQQWDSNPKIQSFLHSHDMKSNQDLQAYFNQRLQKILTKHHRIMIGWDEVLHPDLPKTVVVQSWRGQQSLAAAAKQGYSGILSYGYYLDLMWPAARHYAVDPMSDAAASLSSEEKDRILGGEACMWTEWVTAENLDERVWPRTAAIAERLWSPQSVQDVHSLYTRLNDLSWRLEWLGLAHRSGEIQMLHRIAGTDDISALQVLADVVEPVKDYTRMDTLKTPWDNSSPLNRLVDAVNPESEKARRFHQVVDVYIQSGYQNHGAELEIRTLLSAWRDNDAKLRPLLEQSFLLREVAPLSEDLSSLGTAGLLALDYLGKSEASPEAWREQQLALVEGAKTPKDNLLIMVAAPVQQLIEASANQAK